MPTSSTATSARVPVRRCVPVLVGIGPTTVTAVLHIRRSEQGGGASWAEPARLGQAQQAPIRPRTAPTGAGPARRHIVGSEETSQPRRTRTQSGTDANSRRRVEDRWPAAARVLAPQPVTQQTDEWAEGYRYLGFEVLADGARPRPGIGTKVNTDRVSNSVPDPRRITESYTTPGDLT